MKGRLAFEALSLVSDVYVMESAETLGLWGANTPTARSRGRERDSSPLSRFFNSGWGVASVCALVSIGVIWALILAGNRPPAGPVDTLPPSPNTENTDPTAPPDEDFPIDPPAEDETTADVGDEGLFGAGDSVWEDFFYLLHNPPH